MSETSVNLWGVGAGSSQSVAIALESGRSGLRYVAGCSDVLVPKFGAVGDSGSGEVGIDGVDSDRSTVDAIIFDP